MLVVEDELLIRVVVGDHLRDTGYDVVEAFTGDEAIALLTSGAAIDLVLTDVRMPGSADGLDVLRFVQRTRPGVPVVVASGHLESDIPIAQGAFRFLQKPCSLDAIAEALRAALEYKG